MVVVSSGSSGSGSGSSSSSNSSRSSSSIVGVPRPKLTQKTLFTVAENLPEAKNTLSRRRKKP